MRRTLDLVAQLFFEREPIIQTGKIVGDAPRPEAGISQLEPPLVFLELALVIA